MKKILTSRGGTEVYIILIVILGAFLLAGGQFILKNIVTPPVENQDGRNPLLGEGAGDSSSSSTTWNIQFTKRSCEGTTAHTQVVLSGPAKGYMDLQFQNGTSYFTEKQMGFTPPPSSATYTFDFDGDFNTTPIRLVAYSGGTFTPTNSSSGEGTGTGGTEAKRIDVPATNCP